MLLTVSLIFSVFLFLLSVFLFFLFVLPFLFLLIISPNYNLKPKDASTFYFTLTLAFPLTLSSV